MLSSVNSRPDCNRGVAYSITQFLIRFVSTSAVNYINYAIGFIILILTVRNYGIDARAEYSVSLGIVSTAALFLSFSLGRSVAYIIRHLNDDVPAFFSKYNKTLISLFITLSLLSYGLILIAIYFFPSLLGNVSWFYVVAFSISAPYYIWQYWGGYFYSISGAIHIQNKIVFVNRLLLLLTAYLVISKGCSFLIFLLAIATVNLASMMVEYYFFLSKVTSIHDKTRHPYHALISSNVTLIHVDTIFAYFVISVNILLVNMVLPLYETGVYSIVMQLISLLFVIPATGQVLLQKELSKKDFHTKRVLGICTTVLLFSLLSIVVVTLFSRKGITLMAPYFSVKSINELRDIDHYFRQALGIFFLMSLVHLFNTIFVAMGLIKRLLIITVFIGVLNSTLILVCSKHWGLTGTFTAIYFVYAILTSIYVVLFLVTYKGWSRQWLGKLKMS